MILPWNSADLAASPYVAAVLSCLNSGLYTSSRMIFVQAGRREAPVSLMRVSAGGVPRTAILTSTVVGFLCVIAAAISPDGVFLFLLNSSGAIILFVYLLIAISQIVLRRTDRAGEADRSRRGCSRACRSSSSSRSSTTSRSGESYSLPTRFESLNARYRRAVRARAGTSRTSSPRSSASTLSPVVWTQPGEEQPAGPCVGSQH